MTIIVESYGDKTGFPPTGGDVVTITGSGFGVKARPEPLFHENFEAYPPGTIYTDTKLDDIGTDGKGHPYVRDDFAFSGMNSLRMDWLTGQDMFPKFGVRLVPEDGSVDTGYRELYASFRHRYSRTSGTGSANVYKTFRMGVYPPYSGRPILLESGAVNGVDPSTGYVAANWADGSFGQNDELWDGTRQNIHLPDQWMFKEYYYRISDPAGSPNGAFKAWLDLGLIYDIDPATTLETGAVATIQYFMLTNVDAIGAEFSTWYDDIWIDDTRKRVELGDATPYSSCTVRSPQPAISWSDTAVTVTLNKAGILPGTRYLYVLDDNGDVVNPNGQSVEIT